MFPFDLSINKPVPLKTVQPVGRSIDVGVQSFTDTEFSHESTGMLHTAACKLSGYSAGAILIMVLSEWGLGLVCDSLNRSCI